MRLPFEYKHTRITGIFFRGFKKYPQSYPRREKATPLSPPPEACYPAAIVNHRVTREQHREKTRHDLRRCWKLREGEE